MREIPKADTAGISRGGSLLEIVDFQVPKFHGHQLASVHPMHEVDAILRSPTLRSHRSPRTTP